MGLQIIESAGARVASRKPPDPSIPEDYRDFPISARSHVPRSFLTAIRPDIGESEAYKEAMLRGEIGLQRPMDVNVRGVDFITAVRDGSTEIKEIVCTDVKSSEKGRFKRPKNTIPGTWLSEVQAAVAPWRLKLRLINTDVSGPLRHTFPLPNTPAELAALEAKIVQAVQQVPSRIRLRQLNIDYSAMGQGRITGW